GYVDEHCLTAGPESIEDVVVCTRGEDSECSGEAGPVLSGRNVDIAGRAGGIVREVRRGRRCCIRPRKRYGRIGWWCCSRHERRDHGVHYSECARRLCIGGGVRSTLVSQRICVGPV